MPPFIEISGLEKRFGMHVVIERLNLSIEPGEVVVFQGSSGIGKSTFLRSLIHLDRFDKGRIRVGDIELTPEIDESRDRSTLLRLRQQLSYVFQFFNLFPHFSVLENLMIGPVKVLGESRDQARTEGMALLKRIGLEHKAAALPQTLSGGQQQRVAIARALAMHPKGILFDEPTSSLDPVMKGEIVSLIKEFASDGLTLLLVTHEPAFVEQIATRQVSFGPGLTILADRQLQPNQVSK